MVQTFPKAATPDAGGTLLGGRHGLPDSKAAPAARDEASLPATQRFPPASQATARLGRLQRRHSCGILRGEGRVRDGLNAADKAQQRTAFSPRSPKRDRDADAECAIPAAPRRQRHGLLFASHMIAGVF